jgi:hypothetical protein
MNPKPATPQAENSLVTTDKEDDILPDTEARAIERELDSIKREMKAFFEKTVARVDELRTRLLKKAA